MTRHRPCINPSCDQPQRPKGSTCRDPWFYCGDLCNAAELVYVLDPEDLQILGDIIAAKLKALSTSRPF